MALTNDTGSVTSHDGKNILEGNKLLYDALKHLTTLCTGSILILATFLEKLFSNALWKQLITWTFTFLIFSLITAMLTMLLVANRVYDKPEKNLERVTFILLIITLISFLIGLIIFSVFSVKNF